MISLKINVPLAAFAALILTVGSASADTVIYATSRENSQLLKVNLTTNMVTVIKTTGINPPDSMVVDSLGRLIYDLTDPLASELHRFDPIANTDTVLATGANGLSDPQDIVLEPGGNSVLVSNFLTGTITRTNLTTLVTTTLVAGVVHPEGLAYDGAGNLFALLGFGGTSTLNQINPVTGAILKTSAAFDSTNSLDGLTYDSFTGFLYATSKVGSVIYKINPATLAATLVPGSNIPTPDGLFSDNNGLLYIAARGDSHVYSFNLTTNTATQLTLVPGIDDLGGLVLSPPTIQKTFGAPNLILGGTTSLTITLTNSNPTPLNAISFTDALPAGLTVANPNGLNPLTGCNGIVPTAVAGSTSVSLAGVNLAASGTCTFSVNVTGVTLGPKNNCVTASAPGAGPGNTSCALLTVLAAPPVLIPPTIGKAFGATTIPLNGTTTLTFNISNTNTAPLTGVGFNDTLPVGLAVSTPNGLVGTCGGGTITATAGSTTVSLSGATLPASPGACTFSINVTGTSVGVKNNSVTVFDTVAGTGNTGTANTTVVGPPVIAKVFGASTITVGGTTSLTFSIQNPNTTITLTNISFTDTLPAGLALSNTTVTGTCGGGTILATLPNLISLTGATLAGGANCTFSVNVTGLVLGNQINTTSTITGIDPNGNPLTGPPAVAVLLIAPPPLDPFQIRYAANLDKGDSYVNFTNAGTLSGADPAGRICVNVYTFDPAEEMISCCSCLVTPNGSSSLSAQRDLISNPLTRGTPTSIVIKLLASTPIGGTCNAATPTPTTLVRGMRAWGTTLHALPGFPATYGTTETPFSPVELSATELTKLTTFCGFIQSIGSGFGICKSCQATSLGGATK